MTVAAVVFDPTAGSVAAELFWMVKSTIMSMVTTPPTRHHTTAIAERFWSATIGLNDRASQH